PLSVMTGLHVGRISGAVVGLFLAAAIGGALAEARRLNVAGALTRGIDQLFALAPAADPPDVERTPLPCATACRPLRHRRPTSRPSAMSSSISRPGRSPAPCR